MKKVGTKCKENGQSMVELVLILPFLLLLLVAMVEAGFALRDYLVVLSANREGARYAARITPTWGDPDQQFVEQVGLTRDEIMNAIMDAGLSNEQMDGVSIIITHIYIDPDGEADYDVYSYGTIVAPSLLDPHDLAETNLTNHNAIAPLRVEAKFDEVVFVEVFYQHKNVWGINLPPPYGVGPLGEEWLMHTRSSMRMVGTGQDTGPGS